MKNKLYLVLCLTVSLFYSCKNENSSQSQTPKKRYLMMEKIHWILGTWENKTPDGDFTEQWTRTSDSVYDGVSYVLKQKDTVFYEKMQLLQKNGNLYLEVKVKGQNNEEVVAFRSNLFNSFQMTFENPQHDFPKRIVYNKITEDSIVAGIYGDSKYESFPMKKKKPSHE